MRSGAEFKKRPGLQALLTALEPAAPFQILLVFEQSRLGRDTVRTLGVIQELRDASVKIFAYLDDREISLEGELAESGAGPGSGSTSTRLPSTRPDVVCASIVRMNAGSPTLTSGAA